MRRIHKHLIRIGHNELMLRKGAEFTSAHPQHDQAVLWVIEDTSLELVRHEVLVVGIGVELPPNANLDTYIGTFQMNKGQYVWHVFAGESAQ